VDPERLRAIGQAHDILLLVQFGSSVSGTTHPASDLDLGVLLANPSRSLAEDADLVADLQSLSPGREVDVAILNRADPLLLKQVMDRACLLYGTTRRLAEFRLYAFKRYQDHRRFLDMERVYVARAIDTLRQ
jgi:uncharacterized protein